MSLPILIHRKADMSIQHAQQWSRRMLPLLFLAPLLLAFEGSAQDKFRVDYNYVAFFDGDTESWSDWEPGDNTFVVNVNERGDIAHLKANGETVIYKRLSGVEEGYVNDLHHYQIIRALDDDGDVFSFQIFDDSSIGLKLIYGNVIIQFANL
jgi:hypothetical protein